MEKSLLLPSYFPHCSENYNFSVLHYIVGHSSWFLAKFRNIYSNYYETNTDLTCYKQRHYMNEKDESIASVSYPREFILRRAMLLKLVLIKNWCLFFAIITLSELILTLFFSKLNKRGQICTNSWFTLNFYSFHQYGFLNLVVYRSMTHVLLITESCYISYVNDL